MDGIKNSGHGNVMRGMEGGSVTCSHDVHGREHGRTCRDGSEGAGRQSPEGYRGMWKVRR